ncbi:MAG: MipA/OmpV family protein [Thermodesulfobacteriota bacterium]|nr:MipA/OmpV family protein [Thermodesulfobacteriota bacterium]
MNAKPQIKRDQHQDHSDDWSIRIGVSGMYKPDYEGSEDYERRGFPMFDISWRNRFFLNLRQGLGVYLWKRNDVKVGASISYTFGRDENDSGNLDGLGDIDGGATANVQFERRIDNFSFNVRHEKKFTNEDTGFQVHFGLGYNMRFGRRFMLKTSVKTTYSSSDYMEKYFSITQGQSSQSGLPVYDADSGFKSLGIRIVSIYGLNRHWGVQAMASYDRLLGDTANSPIVKDENQYLLALGLSYMF